MISGLWDVSLLSPKTNLLIFGDSRIPKENQEHDLGKTDDLYKSQKIDNAKEKGEKDGRRTIRSIHLLNSRKSRNWDQYLTENMKLQFGKSLNI